MTLQKIENNFTGCPIYIGTREGVLALSNLLGTRRPILNAVWFLEKTPIMGIEIREEGHFLYKKSDLEEMLADGIIG